MVRELWRLELVFLSSLSLYLKLSAALETSLKQNEADLVMAKQNADAAKKNLDQFRLELERERASNAALSAQLDELKSQERVNGGALKKRVAELDEQLKQKLRELEIERAHHTSLNITNKSLEAKINAVTPKY